ncbi:hypothetical protein NECAME_04673 [Necator americanus]|uniref:ABC transmembrane type-1 domain-containing protein n=1 Tax=Necator americanus TaxID=51031 RepID=W2SRQ6_NECAM|nr:hypothetical protein NECAME_04673 [Necator americanus]ETN71377.1 hypothetical protein NECAME_04673 [Necator americanus]
MSLVRTLIASVEIVVIILWATPASTVVLAPLFAIYFMFLESIQGAASIRAYRLVSEFVTESERKVDENLAVYYPSIVANRWLAVRLELVGNLIVMFAALFAVLFRDSPGLSAGLVGLSVSYALNITQTLNWAVRMTSELETNIVAVERIKEYTDLTIEGAHSKQKPPDSWPQSGKIMLKDDLRSRLTIVPQDPVLFSGTLRFNLDPFDAYTDEEIWKALRNSHLEPFVTSLADRLQYRISEGGENLR